jgi:chromosome partitioning protein
MSVASAVETRAHEETAPATARVITVASNKGGVGKSTIALHLAGALGAVLIDLDWEVAGASNLWGHDPRRARRAVLLDALERGPDASAPRPRRERHRPDLVPTHKDLAVADLDAGTVTDCLLAWAERWGHRYVVVDTHPGLNSLRSGAIAAADLVIVPVLLSEHEADGLEDFLADELAAYNVLIVVNRVPARAARTRIAGRILGHQGPQRAIGPVFAEYRWLPRRRRRAALTLEPDPGAGPAAAAEQFAALADQVREIVG